VVRKVSTRQHSVFVCLKHVDNRYNWWTSATNLHTIWQLFDNNLLIFLANYILFKLLLIVIKLSYNYLIIIYISICLTKLNERNEVLIEIGF